MEKQKTITDIPVFNEISKNQCCGCTACENVCPVQIIKMTSDNEGFLYPEADMNKCIHCNQCVRTCPQIIKAEISDYKTQIYAGSAVKLETVLGGSSGGIFELIAKKFLGNKDENYLYGVAWDDDFKSAKHIGINQVAQLEPLKTSKYIQSDKQRVYTEIKEKLKADKNVMFVGTPCEVAGLKKYLGEISTGHLFTVDFICKGPTSALFMKKYIEEIEHKKKSKVTYVNMRYKWKKLDSWIPQFIMVKFSNGKSMLKEFYNTEIGHAFRILQRPSCYQCIYTGTSKVSDITLGDYHGIKKNDAFYNKIGTSVVMINSLKGSDMIKSLIDAHEVELYEQSIESVCNANPMFVKTGQVNDKRSELAENIQSNSIKKSVASVISIKDKAKMIIPWRIQRKIIMAKKGR